MARPKLKISGEEVFKLAEIGATTEEIADFFNCHTDTVRDRFSSELRFARASGKTRLRMLQWRKAKSMDTKMLIWLGKQYLGQRDRTENVDPDTERRIEEEIARLREEFESRGEDPL